MVDVGNGAVNHTVTAVSFIPTVHGRVGKGTRRVQDTLPEHLYPSGNMVLAGAEVCKPSQKLAIAF